MSKHTKKQPTLGNHSQVMGSKELFMNLFRQLTPDRQAAMIEVMGRIIAERKGGAE